MKHGLTLLKFLVLVLAGMYLWEKLRSVEGTFFSHLYVQTNHIGQNFWLIMTILFFMPLNWFLEAKKWQVVIQPLESISLRQSFKGVLSGLSLGFVTPQPLGDYFGKIAHLKTNALPAIGPVALGQLAQLTVTLFFGSAAVLYLFRFSLSSITLCIFMEAGLIGFAVWIIKKVRLPTPGKGRISNTLLAIKNVKVLVLLCYTMARYIVFSIQFCLALLLFQINLPFELLVFGVYWLK
jgi:hypothetical protein